MKPVHFIALTLLMWAATVQAQSVNVTIQNAANGTPVSTGLMSLYDLTGMSLLLDRVGSGASTMVDPNHQYRVSTDQDRFEHAAAWLKHHAWDGNSQNYLLKHQFDIPPGNQQIFKTADFTNARKTTLFNNFEEFTDEGEVRFRDPWYYVNTEHEQPNALLPFSSPYVPTGAYDKSEPAVMLGKTVQATFPYYSLKFHSFLQSDYVTPKTTALTSDDWVFIGASARNADDVDLTLPAPDDYWSESNGVWSRGDEYAVDVEFKNNESELFGFYKKHMHSSSEIHPTAINSQSKIGKEKQGTSPTKYHQVYESGGKIYYTWSDENRSDFEGEVLVSDFHETALHPSINVASKSFGTLIVIAYVESSTSRLIVKQRWSQSNPSVWSTIATYDLINPSVTHPVLSGLERSSHIYSFLVWENGNDIHYSVFKEGVLVIGIREDQYANRAYTSFSAVVLESGLYYPDGSRGTPKYPLVYSDECSSTTEVIWTERPKGIMRYKALTFMWSASTPPEAIIKEHPPIFASGAHPIRDNTGASMIEATVGGWCASKRIIAYEYYHHIPTVPRTGGFPVPTSLVSWPLAVQGRTFMPISAVLTGYANPWIAHTSSLVLKVGDAVSYRVTSFPYVTHLYQYITPTNGELAPSIGRTSFSQSNYAVGFNADHQNKLYRLMRLTHWAPTPTFVPTWDQTSDGLYPQITHNVTGKSMVALSCGDVHNSPAGPGSMVEARDILHELKHTSNGVGKTSETVRLDQLRRLAFTASDSSVAHYGVATPHLVVNDTVATPLEWDTTCDSLPYFWWGDLKNWIRTEPFTVPQNGGQVIFGAELYAMNASDLGANFRMALECRDASNHEVLYAEEFNFNGFNPDSAFYVQDQIDLSSIPGEAVYFCVNPIDTTSSCSFEVVNVITPWFESLEKDGRHSKPAARSIRIAQNYPNPFNPTTIIPFELAEDGHVTIQVLDMLGRVVRTLREGKTSRGAHTVAFDGSGLRSGMYVCRITAFDQIAAVKMHLIK